MPLATCLALTLAAMPTLDRANVVWTTPGHDSSASMPLGNGDIGLNVWTEGDSDLVLLISKSDAWSGQGRLLKVGRVRLTLGGSPWAEGQPFRMEHVPREAKVLITAAGRTLTVWVDANRPTVWVEQSGPPTDVTVKVDSWRTAPRTLEGKDRFSAYGIVDAGQPIVQAPDLILPARDGRLAWCQRNDDSIYGPTLRHQGLESLVDRFPDPLLHRTFGATVSAPGLVVRDNTTLAAPSPVRDLRVGVTVLTAQTASVDVWRSQLDDVARAAWAVPRDAAWRAHTAWWQQFWDRSWIDVTRAAGIDGAGGISTNTLPLRIGADSDSGNRFHGVMQRVVLTSLAGAERHVVADWRVAELAGGLVPNHLGGGLDAKVVGELTPVADGLRFDGKGYLEVAHDPRLDLTGGLLVEAWLAPDVLPGGGARIVDKSRAGTANGWCFDTFPGNSLRLIVEAGTTTRDAQLKPGAMVRVAARFDGSGTLLLGEQELPGAKVEPPELVLTRGYVLQRFLNAAAGRGGAPIKFNGSLFCVDVPAEHLDLDYRAWGGCYWFQNTRLPYWSMLAAGDWDLMRPLFRMYHDALPLAEARTKLYYGHSGAFWPETMYFWGTYNNDNYGWDRAGKPLGLTDNTYIRYYWDSGLELTQMMLDYAADTGDQEFVRGTLLPFASAVVTFYDQHWPREQGRLKLEPAQSLETWQQATNPTPVVAGLHAVLPRLLALPAAGAPAKAEWRRLLGELPDVPLGQRQGKKVIVAGEKLAAHNNVENPELYAVWPYRLYGLGRPDLDVARETFNQREYKHPGGWPQDPIQAACLGLTADAASNVLRRFATHHSGSRFPAFWGPNFDWVPDQCHGGVAMTALQSMLLQTDGKAIRVFPAWPRGWDVSFKLHGPDGLVVEGACAAGKTTWKVTPAERAGDVIVG